MAILTPVKFKKIQPEHIGTKIPTEPLLECHYSYIRGFCYYPSTNSNHFLRLSLNTLCIVYCLTATSKYL